MSIRFALITLYEPHQTTFPDVPSPKSPWPKCHLQESAWHVRI